MERGGDVFDISESVGSDQYSEDSIVVVKDWHFDPISKVEVNESTDDTFILLQHLNEGSSKESLTREKLPKAHIGPRPRAVRTKPAIVRDGEWEKALLRVRKLVAVRRIQRWYRRHRLRNRGEGLSEMRSAIACECGCVLT